MLYSPCKTTRMTFLTSAIVFTIVLAGVMTGEAQETGDSLFLDTTLVPVVELSIKNIARSSKAETNPSPATQHVNNSSETSVDMSGDVDDQSSSVVEATVTPSKESSPTMIDFPSDSFLHSASFDSNLAFQTLTVGESSHSVALETGLMPSFTTAASRSTSKHLIPSTVGENALTSLKASESSAVSLPDDTTAKDGIATPGANGGAPDLSSSYMAVKMSSSGVQLNEGSKDFEKSASENAFVITNTEFVTPTSWLAFDTESASHAQDMHYGNQFDESSIISASPEPTSTETYYGGFSSEVVESGKAKQDQNLHGMFVHSKSLGFVLKKRCSDDHESWGTFERLNGLLVQMLNSTAPPNENQSTFECETLLHFTVPVGNMTDSMIKETIGKLTTNLTFEDNFRMEKIYLYRNDHDKVVLFSADPTDQVVNFDEYTRSERELIAYIVAGISLATLVFILLTCCCVRFLCKRETNSLDLCDIPHLNLKLEDYKLTPIPRPTISFSEYGRELFNPSYSEHTPKLEDTILSQQRFAAEASNPGARESMSFPREMRTFGGKKSCSRVQSLDARPKMRSGNGWMSNSREKLSTDFERRNSGFDNVAFRKWF